MPDITSIPVATCPTLTKCFSDFPGLYFLYISHVIRVEQELNTDDKELIRADNIPAATNPLNPAGKRMATIYQTKMFRFRMAIKVWSKIKQLRSFEPIRSCTRL